MRNQVRISIALLLALPIPAVLTFAAGCAADVKDKQAAESPPRHKPVYETVTLKGRTFELELALDRQSRARGLKGRNSLADNEGMLFAFPPRYPFPAEISFWMKDCLVAIDVIFIGPNGVITAIHEMQPPLPGTPDDRLPRYPSKGPAQFAIEIRGGLAGELGLEVGERIKLRYAYLAGLAEM